jgi:tetratricopeptide (TPR) repeat protein
MRKTLLFTFIVISHLTFAQIPALVDSLKDLLNKATSEQQKFDITANLSRILMNTNPAEADLYGQQLIQIAETSRERDKMVNALLINGERFSYLAGRRDNIEKAIGYFNRGLELAIQNKIDTLIVKTYLLLSGVNRNVPDYDKSLNYCNQANSYAVILKKDSITAKVHLEYGSVYLGKNEKLLALRNLLAAVRIGDELKSITLRRDGYNKLSGFYAIIEDYAKAIDFQVKAIQLIPQLKAGNAPYLKVQELNRTGDLYGYKKDYPMASFYYEKALALADSLRYEPIKAMIYRSVIYNYISLDQPQKALDYFNTHPQLKAFLQQVNFSHFIDLSYGYIYMSLGKFDSAKYFYNKAGDFFEKDVNISNKYGYYYQLGKLYQKTGETGKSLDYFLKAKEIADQIGDLDQMRDVVRHLDSIYQQKGDYKEAFLYASLDTKYKDSLNKLGKEKDLLDAVAKDDDERRIELLKQQAEAKRRKNNIQYMSIVIGIVVLFFALVILGMFKVSRGLIKAVGFFVFLMLFEFIFLVFKKNIYYYTHGEPWKDLMFMIALAAMLVPLHHWMEHKVLHYLTSHNRLTAAGHHIKNKFFRKSRTDIE